MQREVFVHSFGDRPVRDVGLINTITAGQSKGRQLASYHSYWNTAVKIDFISNPALPNDNVIIYFNFNFSIATYLSLATSCN